MFCIVFPTSSMFLLISANDSMNVFTLLMLVLSSVSRFSRLLLIFPNIVPKLLDNSIILFAILLNASLAEEILKILY